MRLAPPFWIATSSREIHEVLRNFPFRPVILSPHPSLPPRVIFGDDDIVSQSILVMTESPMGIVELSMAQFGLRRTILDEEERRKTVRSIIDVVCFFAEEFWARETSVLELNGTKKTNELCVVSVNPLLPSQPIAFSERMTLEVAVRVALSRSNITTIELQVRPKTYLWLNHLVKDRV